MRRFRLRGLWRVNTDALLVASGQNLKRLLQKRGWGRRPFSDGVAAAVADFSVLRRLLIALTEGSYAGRSPRRIAATSN